MDKQCVAKLLCVPFKDSHSTEKIRRRILKRLKKVERKSCSSMFVKTLPEPLADDIHSVSSNSKYVAFLLKDGRVCRMRVSSVTDVATQQFLPDSRRGGPQENDFQVLSDAEYARRLQAQFDQETNDSRSNQTDRFGNSHEMDIIRSDVVRGLPNLSTNALSPYISLHSWSPPTSPSYPTPPNEYVVPAHNPYLPLPLSTFSNVVDADMATTSSATNITSSTTVPGDTNTVDDSQPVRQTASITFTDVPNSSSKKKEDIWPDIGDIEWLVAKQNPDSLSCDDRFVSIAVLHSEILLVGATTRQLYSWPCVNGVVNPQPHPLNDTLELSNERICHISSNNIRVSLVTESGGVVTFYDKLLRGCSENGVPPLISSLSHGVQLFPELVNDPVVDLSVSDFTSFVITRSGKVYWWGLCPQIKSSASSDDHASSVSISEGALVRLKNGPPCGANALVLQCSKTHGPRVGQTVNIIERSSVDPTTSVLVKVLSQAAVLNSNITETIYDGLEVWKQAEIVFLDDSPAILGRVVAVDNNQAIVDISYTTQNDTSGSTTDPTIAQKSLKVFRLSELAPCVGIDVNTSTLSKDSSLPPNGGKGFSRHVAGIVQHHPVCILDPSPGTVHQMNLMDETLEEDVSRSVLKGFYPLAMHPTNTGPYLLVRRLSDGHAFIVCTVGTSSRLLRSSSFVAVGERDQKPQKCTLEEESCHARECGLEAWFPSNDQSTIELISKYGGRKRKQRKFTNDMATHQLFPLKSSVNKASFIDLYNSEILCLHDIHGSLITIPSGLRLKPTQPRYLDFLSNWFPNSDPVLSLPYQVIISHQYTVQQNKKVLVVLAVPKNNVLIPSVMKVDILSVERIVNAISNHVNSQCTNQNSSFDESEMTPSKKMALEEEVGGEPTSAAVVAAATDTTEEVIDEEDVEMDTKPNEIEFTNQMSIDSSEHQESTGLPVADLNNSVLYECTVHNYNILHVCVARKDMEDEKQAKVFIPYKGDNGLNYQSLTAYQVYRQTSFEELRQDYYSKGGYEISADMKRDWQDIAYAQIMMLEKFLSCEAIRPDIIKLLCQKNSFGETPFLTALAYQNFTGALKIMTFVDHLVSSSPEENKYLFEEAILTCNSAGMTPLQIFYASYSTCYDTLSMKLYVSSLPLGYTAQQLLSLFKEYYPSVYKAEVTKDYDEDDIIEVEDSTDPESDDEPYPQLAAVGLSGVTRVTAANRHRNVLQNASFLDHNIPLRGVVYFNDIKQLRSAHLEMQDFRVFSNYNGSRTGSFGQSHSMSFLAVGLEPEESNEEQSEGDGGFPTLLDVGHGIVSRVAPARRSRSGGLRVGFHMPKTPPSLEARKESRKKRASAGLREASSLLCAMLSRPEFVTALDRNEETTTASLIHNQRCINALKQLCSPPPYSKYRGGKNTGSILTTSSSSKEDSSAKSIPVAKQVDSLANNDELESSPLWRPFGDDPVSNDTNSDGVVLRFGKDETMSPLKESLLSKEPAIENSSSNYPRKDCSTCNLHGIEYLTGSDLVYNIYTSWPSIVTTILGYNPFLNHLIPPTFSSTQKLDDFVNTLFVSNEGSLALAFIAVISAKVNEALAAGEDIRAVNVNDIDGMTPSNIPLYVGLRYMGAVVRTLALEHSRVKGTVVELPSSTRDAAADRLRHQEMKGRLIHDLIKSTLISFSWLAVDALAKAAETACLPVRLGVAKPFGANSVTNEYRSLRNHSSMRSVSDRSRNRSLNRQYHVRSALLATEDQILHNSKLLKLSPPSCGLRLVPQNRGGVQSLQEDGYQDEFGMDLSDSDIPASEIGNDSFELSQNRAAGAISTPPRDIPRYRNYIDNESSDEDEDDPFSDLMDNGLGRNGSDISHDVDDPMEGIYPYAWALDARRIGENTPVIRPTSPTSSFFGHGELTTPLSTIPSIRFGSGFLARTFARMTKDLVDIVQRLCTQKEMHLVELPVEVAQPLIQSTIDTLDKTWLWVSDVLDVAEGQLQQGKIFDTQRYVATLRGSVRAVSPSATPSVVQRIITRTASKSFIGSTPGEYITYLLRSQANVDKDCLPVIDLYGYEHVVYVLDALIYTLNKWPKEATNLLLSSNNLHSSPATNEIEDTNDDAMDGTVTPPKQRGPSEERFFTRTDSVIDSEEDLVRKWNADFFGSSATSPVATRGPLQEAVPLAKQPHLLKPYARKEQLFNNPNPESSSDRKKLKNTKQSESDVRLPLSYLHLDKRHVPRPVTLVWSADDALKRWSTAISVFAHIFLAEGPGSEKANFLNTRAGFASRMARFRHQVSQLFDSTQGGRGEWGSVSNTLSIRVRRDHLLEDSLEYLGHMTKFHFSQVRVKFEGEDGSGPGVNRGFFASLANAIKNSDITLPPCNKIGGLFYQPGKEPEQSGLYAPQPAIPTCTCGSSTAAARQSAIRSQRLNAFKAIGRFIGLCFWFKHTIPFMLCRHVAKYLLDRDLAWHDLAFFNADLYEGLRRMMLDTKSGKTKEEFQATYCCYFEAPISSQKLSGISPEVMFKDLIPGGSKIPVTPDRVEEYVRLYATFVMVGCVRDELMAMRNGLTDIIPHELLLGLTAEDFQLLLSGDSASISLQRLRSVMKFNHTHGRSPQICDRFEKMFWRVVSHMNNTQRQQLLYFATGSASLPISSDEEPSSVIINIDVIGSSNTDSLPVASTCSQRMSIPLYPSYNTLKHKLMQAIQCQAYGLG